MPSPDWYHPIDYADLTRLRALSSDARWTFLELFCGELGTKTGLVEVRPALIAAELDAPRKEIERHIAELAQAGLLVYDSDNRLAYHLGHLIRHGAVNPKNRAGWFNQIAAMPNGIATVAALSELDGIPYRNGMDTVSVRYPVLPKQEQEQEQEQEQFKQAEPIPLLAPSKPEPKPKAAPRASGNPWIKTPPTLAETIAILRESGCPEWDADRIARDTLAYWESVGFARANKPIVSWPGTVRTSLSMKCERDPKLASRVDDERRRRANPTPTATTLIDYGNDDSPF